MSGRRRAVALLAVVAALVVVAAVAFVALRGNGSGVEARPTVTPSSPPPSSATQTPTPGPTVAPPVLPAAAMKRDQKGAEAFFRYFIDVYNYSFEALDTQSLSAVSAAECKFCKSAKLTVQEISAKRARAEGGQVRVITAIAEPDAARAREVIVVSLLEQDSGRTVAADGTVTSSSSGSRRQLDALLRWEGGQWRLVGVETATK